VTELGAAGGTVLGAFDDALFEQTTLVLDPGDTLLLLTDGILEAQEADGQRPGVPGILRLLEREPARSVPALAQALCDDVLQRGGTRIQDDMTVFVLRRP
jgi:phosphoserine phosphatase RsbU/P